MNPKLEKNAVTAALVLLCSACSTTMLSTWKKPGADLSEMDKVVVVVRANDESVRRSAESRIVQNMGPARATPSHELAPEATSTDTLRDRVEGGGYDGAIVVRVVGVDKKTEWVGGAGPGYGYGAWYATAPYQQTTTYVRVETSIYSLPDQTLLWSATSRTVEPSNVQKLVDETVKAVRKELAEEGLIPPDRVSQAPAPARALERG